MFPSLFTAEVGDFLEEFPDDYLEQVGLLGPQVKGKGGGEGRRGERKVEVYSGLGREKG